MMLRVGSTSEAGGYTHDSFHSILRVAATSTEHQVFYD